MIHLFCGFDPREAVGFHVFANSVLERASQPVSIVALDSRGLPQGSNSFTLSRFLVPHLMRNKGHAIFADASDMLCLADIAELDALFDPACAVQVVQRPDYASCHPRKYVGTAMECEQSNYSRKNWASLMLINCEHWAWRFIYPRSIEEARPIDLLQLRFCGNDIGELPAKWNVLVDEGDEAEGAAILHWTAGIPAFPHYKDAPAAEKWHQEVPRVVHCG